MRILQQPITEAIILYNEEMGDGSFITVDVPLFDETIVSNNDVDAPGHHSGNAIESSTPIIIAPENGGNPMEFVHGEYEGGLLMSASFGDGLNNIADSDGIPPKAPNWPTRSGEDAPTESIPTWLIGGVKAPPVIADVAPHILSDTPVIVAGTGSTQPNAAKAIEKNKHWLHLLLLLLAIIVLIKIFGK